MKSMIDVIETCAGAGLKRYVRFTVNPRPFDLITMRF